MPVAFLLAALSLTFLVAAVGMALRPTRRRRLAALLAAGALAFAAAAAWHRDERDRERSREALQPHLPASRDDSEFATSDSCRACHPSQFASWHDSFHRTMTQPASPQTVTGRFDGIELESRGRRYRLERRSDEYWVELIDPDWERLLRLQGADPLAVADPPRVERRVVMLTGSHHMQTYWLGSRYGRELLNLPFVFLHEEQRWAPREDVFLRPPEADPFIDLWNDNCLECHATAGIPGLTPTSDAFDTRVAELGISCEACHGPAAEHVRVNRNPLRRYRYRLGDEPDPSIVQPARLEHQRSSEVCGQCHSVTLSDAQQWLASGHAYRAGDQLPATRFLVRPAVDSENPRLVQLVEHEPMAIRSRFWADGLVRVSGREYSSMIESACFQRGELSCLSCHSLHDSDPDDQLSRSFPGDASCLQCHEGMRQRAAAHSHHPGVTGRPSCLDCHMPYTTYGLLKGIRSHTISNPSVTESVVTGRPNACNLCHLDRSLSWSAGFLASWYGQTPPTLSVEQREVSAAVLWALTGDAGQRALVADAMGRESALAASGRGWEAPFLGHLLADPYAAVRFISYRSLRRLPIYRGFEFDFVGSSEERRDGRDRALRQWLSQPVLSVDRTGDGLLIASDGTLQVERLGQLSRQRDDRPLALGE